VVLTVDPKALRNRLTKRDNKGPWHTLTL
jgi:hypothetical protein